MRRMRTALILAILVVCGLAWLPAQQTAPARPGGSELALPEEKHLRNVRQLTFAGENAEAYFSADNRLVIFQAHSGANDCDQIYIMHLDTEDKHRVSNGQGKTTCGYFFPRGDHVLYSSTHLAGPACPPRPDYSRGYVWPVYPDYDIFTARLDGGDLRRRTATPGYDAEATV